MAYAPADDVWTTPTSEPGENEAKQETYAGGMPLGNGRMVALVWPNVSFGSIEMYVRHSDALALDSTLLTLSHVVIQMTPNPFSKSGLFEQRLMMQNGTIRFLAGETTVFLSVDPDNDALRVSTSSASAISLAVTAKSVRGEGISTYYNRECWQAKTGPDVFLPSMSGTKFAPNTIVQYHRNDKSTDLDIFNLTLVQQGLPNAASIIPNALENNTFGIAISGHTLTRTSPSTLTSSAPATSHTVDITSAAVQTSTASEFLDVLATVAPSFTSTYWTTFWDRTFITGSNITSLTPAYDRNRYVQAIQSRGKYPIKFNGMLFVANRERNPDDQTGGGPDYRAWGASNWHQNTRLPYENMVLSGDWEEMKVWFEYFLRMLPLLRYRTQQLLGHPGAFVTETKMVYGIYNAADYGCSRPQGYPVWMEDNDYIHLDFGGNAGLPEVGIFLLDYFDVSQNKTALVRYLPIINDTLQFFLHHYPNRDSNGKMVIYPTQALETFWCPGWPPGEECVTNDMPTVALVTQLAQRALALPADVVAPYAADWKSLLDMMPPLPVANGVLQAAEKYMNKRHNEETPELYAVHPARIYSVASTYSNPTLNLTIAQAAFLGDSYAERNEGWEQGIMNAALLGLVPQASGMVLARATSPPAAGYRWAGFAPHYQDYEPSADHFANYNSALQWMLLQNAHDANGTIVVFPSWPCDWNVNFQLIGSQQTTVTVNYQNGTLLEFAVNPPSRKNAVKFHSCV